MADAWGNAQDVLFSFSGDSLVVLTLFALLLFYGFKFGRDRLVVLSLSFFIGSVLYQLFPYIREFTLFSGNAGEAALSQGLIWLLAVIFSHFVLSRLPALDYERRGIAGGLASVFSAGATAAYLLAVAHTIVPLAAVYPFSSSVSQIFSGTEALFWTSAALLISVLFASRA